MSYNVSRLEAVANFGNVIFRLLLNFLRTINVIEPHILPLLSNRCYAMVLFHNIGLGDLYKTHK